MIHQLRIYEIFDTNKSAFHARFRDHAALIMRRHDFRIIAMWETRFENKTEFIYLLEGKMEMTVGDDPVLAHPRAAVHDPAAERPVAARHRETLGLTRHQE